VQESCIAAEGLPQLAAGVVGLVGDGQVLRSLQERFQELDAHHPRTAVDVRDEL
jgi:hypothetical protein